MKVLLCDLHPTHTHTHTHTHKAVTINSKRDVSLTVHFLYPMVFLPQPRVFRRLEAFLNPFILWGEMSMITDFGQFFHFIVAKIHIGPIFRRHISSKKFWHKKCHFSNTHIRRKLTLFKTCLCLSNTLARSGNPCFPPCFETNINGHLNGLIDETVS